jgi:hypothetical protein
MLKNRTPREVNEQYRLEVATHHVIGVQRNVYSLILPRRAALSHRCGARSPKAAAFTD